MAADEDSWKEKACAFGISEVLIFPKNLHSSNSIRNVWNYHTVGLLYIIQTNYYS